MVMFDAMWTLKPPFQISKFERIIRWMGFTEGREPPQAG